RLARDLQTAQAELAESQQQIQQLRKDMEALRQQLQAGQKTDEEQAESSGTSADGANYDTGFLAAKVSELHQDKVESASKYPVKISGLILFNSFVNSGPISSSDLPVLALPASPDSPKGSIGATLGQTLLGVEVKGPTLFGAHSSADAAIDFAGGYPTTAFGVT